MNMPRSETLLYIFSLGISDILSSDFAELNESSLRQGIESIEVYQDTKDLFTRIIDELYDNIQYKYLSGTSHSRDNDNF